MTWILTYTGRHFDFRDPRPEIINIADIGKGLASESRFAGQTQHFYSVAQHSVLASEIVPPEFALEALLHDAAEAYCKDIPTPLKAMLPDYRAIEARVDAAIRRAFGLPEWISREVRQADLTLLATERRDLMISDENTPWPCLAGVRPLAQAIKPLPPKEALGLFVDRYVQLIGKD